jgi:predicted nucleic acid-binding Zn ribbon protein
LEFFLFSCWCRTGGTNCIRCFELTLRSLNVVQIHTEGLDKCYTTEEAAMATCPTDESIATGKSREIMLYSEFFKKPSPLLFFFLIFLAFFVWVYYLLFSVKKNPLLLFLDNFFRLL